LDSLTEEEISETIREVSVRKDLITILIAHRLSTVIHADKIFVLERGRIVESGRHDELVELKGLYYAMWRQQIGEREPLSLWERAARSAGRGLQDSRESCDPHFWRPLPGGEGVPFSRASMRLSSSGSRLKMAELFNQSLLSMAGYPETILSGSIEFGIPV